MTALNSFSTEGLRRADRRKAWHEHVTVTSKDLDVDAFSEESIVAEQHRREYPEFTTSLFISNEHSTVRSSEMTLNRPKHSTFISIILNGSAMYYSSSVSHQVSIGNFIVLSADVPYMFGWHPGTVQLHAEIPSTAFSVLTGGFDDTIAQMKSFATQNLAVCSLTELKAIADDFSDPTSLRGPQKAHSLMQDILGALNPGKMDYLYQAAIQTIAEDCRDFSLTPTILAQKLAVSVRHLSRAFSERNTSIAKEIMFQRVEIAQTEISRTDLPLVEIAIRCGFGSRQTMLRSFLRMGRLQPSAYRPH